GVVPRIPGQVRALEAEARRGPLMPGMPFTHQARAVPGLLQRGGERERVRGQVLEVADVPFMVREDTVAERGGAGEEARPGRGADRGGGVPAVEAGTGGRERVRRGGETQGAAVAAEGVHPVLVGHE